MAGGTQDRLRIVRCPERTTERVEAAMAGSLGNIAAAGWAHAGRGRSRRPAITAAPAGSSQERGGGAGGRTAVGLGALVASGRPTSSLTGRKAVLY